MKLRDEGKIVEVKIYPRFGTTVGDGHAFACFGSSMWADDVFQFLERHCPGRR